MTPKNIIANKIISEMADKGMKVRNKRDLFLWKLMPKKNRNRTTTIGKTIWLAENQEEISNETLVHEYIHLKQFEKHGLWRMFKKYTYHKPWAYIASVLSSTVVLLCCGFWIALVAFLFLTALSVLAPLVFPIGNNGRFELEREAFAAQSAFRDIVWRNPLSDEYLEKIFVGMDYFKMVSSEEWSVAIGRIRQTESEYEYTFNQWAKDFH